MGDATKRAELDSTITNTASAPGAPADARPAFAAGEVVAQRYRIVRLIARGGMGAVYEAEDLSLHQRVALKTIRSERAYDARAIDRFKREVLLARKVTHKNVCRVFDVGSHGDELFLTMELLEGETLSARLRRDGPLPVAEALPLVEQMVAALASAHHAGIVHRDLKCSNVMLAGGRVVVTDFGLAHDVTAEEHERSRDGFIGSPAYIAPEQVGGRQVGFAADIYALGIVMFEMVTGRLPFVGATPMATAVLRLNEAAPSARALVPELPEVWDATIARCLRREPEERFAQVEDVVRALAGEAVAPPPRRRRRLGRALTAGVVALLAAAAAGVGGWRWSHPAALRQAHPTVAVLAPTYAGGGDDAWRATAFAELLSSQLAAGGLRTLPRDLLVRRGLDGAVTPAALARLRDNGAPLAVAGTCRPSGDGLAFAVELVDTRSGRTLDRIEETAAPSALFDAAARVATRLRHALGQPDPSAAQAPTRAALPTKPEAARLYTDGLTALRRFQPGTAQHDFEAALEVEPDQPLVYAALAEAWHDLEAEQREREAAQHAFEHSANLPREARLSIEAAYREALKDWEGAAQIRVTLATFFPDNLEYGLRLAEAQRRAGHGDDALATLARLRHLPPPDGDDPRIDLAEARTRERNDPKGALAAIGRAVAGATKRGAPGVAADAHVLECSIDGGMMKVDAAEAACRQAMQSFTAEGNRGGVARATIALAQVDTTARRNQQALALEAQAESIYHELGSPMGEVRARMMMAIAYKRAADYAKSERLLRDAIDTLRAADEPQLMIKAMDDLASNLTDEHRLDEALPYYRKVIETAHASGLSSTEANAMSNLSITLERYGKLEEARRLADGAVALWRSLGHKNDMTFGLDSVEQIALRQGRLADAQKAEEEALAVRETLGWDGSQSRQNLAELTMVQGNLPRAEALGRQAVEELHKEREPLGEIYALDVLIRIYMAGHKVADAEAALARVGAIEKQLGSSTTLTGSEALIKAAHGDVAGALAELRAGIADADRQGFVDSALDLRDVMAEVLVEHGPRDEARRAVEALRKQAATYGYNLYLRDVATWSRKLR